MEYKVSDNFLVQLEADLDKKYLASGVKLGGSIKENKIKLYTTDEHGKHSNFATRIFNGRVNNNSLSGKFLPSLYVVLLLVILTFFCIESVVMAIISSSLQSLIFPVVIIAAEIAYFLSLKRISSDNDKLITKYLEDNKVED